MSTCPACGGTGGGPLAGMAHMQETAAHRRPRDHTDPHPTAGYFPICLTCGGSGVVGPPVQVTGGSTD